jgi:hypothetical protein
MGATALVMDSDYPSLTQQQKLLYWRYARVPIGATTQSCTDLPPNLSRTSPESGVRTIVELHCLGCPVVQVFAVATIAFR